METVTISKAEYDELLRQNADLQQRIDYLMAQMRLARRRQFGSSSEKSEYDQLSLFDEAEAYAGEKAPEPEVSEVKAHYRKKAAQSKEKLPGDLPVEIIEHTLPEEEQSCPECGNHLHVIGKNVRETLKLIPAKAVIERHVQYVYGCRECEKNACSVPVIKAKADTPLIKGSIASAEAVAQIMTQKFVMGIPLYRQEQEWNRNGISLSRQTMSNWLIKCTEDYLVPIYDRLHEQLVQQEVIHADETTLQVLHEESKPPQSKSYVLGQQKYLARYLLDGRLEFSNNRAERSIKPFVIGRKNFMFANTARDAKASAVMYSLVETAKETRKAFCQVIGMLQQKGLLLRKGTIVDEAPSSTKDREKRRDPDAHQVKKGNAWHFGYKAHIGVDRKTGLVHHLEVTGANVHDVTVVSKLLSGEEMEVYGDSGYLGTAKREDAITHNSQAGKSTIKPTADLAKVKTDPFVRRRRSSDGSIRPGKSRACLWSCQRTFPISQDTLSRSAKTDRKTEYDIRIGESLFG